MSQSAIQRTPVRLAAGSNGQLTSVSGNAVVNSGVALSVVARTDVANSFGQRQIFVDGTTTVPGVAFAGNNATGLRRTSTNEVATVIGGADRLVVGDTRMAFNSTLRTNFTSFNSQNTAQFAGLGYENPNVFGAVRIVFGEAIDASPWRGGSFDAYNSSYSGTGFRRPNSVGLSSWNGASAGLSIGTENSSAPVVFYIGGYATTNERLRLDPTTGNFSRSAASSTTSRVQFIDVASWADSTDATRRGRYTMSVLDAAGTREVVRLETDGSRGYLAQLVHTTPIGSTMMPNGSVSFSTNGSGHLVIHLRDSGGTVRTGTVTLT